MMINVGQVAEMLSRLIRAADRGELPDDLRARAETMRRELLKPPTEQEQAAAAMYGLETAAAMHADAVTETIEGN